MAIPNKQIGWSNESNLLWNISSQLDRLTKVISNFAPPGANIYNSDGTLTGNRVLSGANNDLTFADLNIFKTSVAGNDIGLKLDFGNTFYEIGDFNSNNFRIQTNNNTIQGTVNAVNAFLLDGLQGIYKLGDYDFILNNTSYIIDDTNQIIQTTNQGNNIGLMLDFANSLFYFGDVASNEGLFVNTILGRCVLGDPQYVKNGVVLNVSNQISTINTEYQGSDIGLKLDFANNTYQFGQLTGGNATQFKIDDAAAYPVQVSGTNVSANTAGAASGQFLKIKVGGVDYKIALLNP